MTDTVHALLIDPTGTVSDLRLSTDPHTQARQVHDLLGDDAEIVGYAHHEDGSHTVAFAGELREDLPPNLPAALALVLLTDTSLIVVNLNGPVLFAGFASCGHLTDLTPTAISLIRTVEPRIPGTLPKTGHPRS
ncbi:hypothetical protein [Streptomyces sp. NPDC001155]